MKFKKIEKNILICSLSVVGLGAIVGTSWAVTNELKMNKDPLLSNNNNQNESNKVFSGTTLTKNDVKEIGWDKKTTISLNDWKKQAPKVTQIGDESTAFAPFYANNLLQSIEIPAQVTNISNSSFYSTPSLTKVTFEENSSLTRVGKKAFNNSAIEEISIPQSVKSIGEDAFRNISNLSSDKIFLPEELKKSEAPLYGFTEEQWEATKSTKATFDGRVLTKAAVNQLGWNKAEITLADWDNAPNVVEISPEASGGPTNDSAFAQLTNIRKITIPARIQKINYSSFWQSQIQDVIFESGSQLKSLGINAFFASQLRSILIPVGTTVIDSFALARTKLTQLIIPNSVTTIGANAFQAIDSTLSGSNIRMPVKFRGPTAQYGLTTEQWSSIEWLRPQFTGSSLFKSDVTALGWNNRNEITFYDWANEAPNVTRIAGVENASDPTGNRSAFSGIRALRSVQIPDKVTRIDFSAFARTLNLSTVTFTPNSKLVDIDKDAFNNSGIQNIVIPSTTTRIGQTAFGGTTSLRSVSFAPNSKIKSIERGAFFASNIRSITIPNVDGLTIANDVFQSTSLLRDISMPDSLRRPNPNSPKYGFTQQQWNSIKWGDPQFQGTILTKDLVTSFGWDRKTNITLEDWKKDFPNVTELGDPNITSGLGDKAPFSFNNNLVTIAIPAKVTKFNYSAFHKTPNLKTVTFESGSQLNTIGGYVFRISGITTISIPNSVTTIGEAAFRETNLTSINIPASVTTLGKQSFRDTIALRNITFSPNSRLTTIGVEAFWLSGISKIVIPKSVTSIQAFAFIKTGSLTDLTFEADSRLTSIGDRAFQETRARELDIPNSVTNMHANAFGSSGFVTNISLSSSLRRGSLIPIYGLNDTQWRNIKWKVQPFTGTTLKRADIIDLNWWGKQQITLTDWNLARNVTHLGVGAATGNLSEAAFANNTTLTNIVLPTHLTNIGFSAFSGTTSLQTVTFQSASKVTNIWNKAFEGSRIRSINIPNSVTTIAADAFATTNSLLGASISMSSNLRKGSLTGLYGFSNEQWNSIAWRIEPFRGTTLTKTDVINLNWHIKSEITQQDWTTNASLVNQISVAADGGSTTNSAFSDNTTLTKIFIPARVTQINYSSFSGTRNLRTVDFEQNSRLVLIGHSSFKGSGVSTLNVPNATKTIGYEAFSGASSLSAITFSNSSQLEQIHGRAFVNATALQELILPEKTQRIFETAFWNNRSLRKVYIPNSVTNIGTNVFHSTNSLTGPNISMLITLRGSDTTTPKYGFTQEQWNNIAWRAVPFDGATLNKQNVIDLGWDLKTSITLQDWITNAPRVTQISTSATSGDASTAAFAGNTKLTTIAIPDTITRINYGSFKGATALQTVTFESGSSLSAIEASAFEQSSINSIIIPSSLKTIGNASFKGASSLRTITFEPGSTLTSIGDEAFQSTNISAINVPSSVTTIGNNAFQNTGSLQGSSVSMDISLRKDPAVVKYGFTPDQWNSIVWRGNVTLTDTITSFRINFTENKNIVDLPELSSQASATMSDDAKFAGLSLQFAVGTSESSLFIQWGTATEVKSRIATYAASSSILKSQINIYARMYLPSATGDANNVIGNVTYNWKKEPIEIYNNSTGIIAGVFVAPGSTTILSDKFIRAYSKIADNWATSLSAGGNKSSEVKVTSLDGSFDIASYTRLGVKLEVNPTAETNSGWVEITTLGGQTFNASATNKMKFRLSVTDNKFYEMIGDTVQPSTTPSGIMSRVVEKEIVAKIELPGINAAELITNKITVSGTTHNLSITENSELYTVSGLSLADAKTYFEIKYSHDGINYFNAVDFVTELKSLRGAALNNLVLANFKVRYEFTTAGLQKYYSTQVANDTDAVAEATKTLVTRGVKKTIDVTTPIADIANIQISGTTQDIKWKGNESILALTGLLRVEYGTYQRPTDGGNPTYTWSEALPTSLYITTAPPGRTEFPLAIRFIPKADETETVQIGSIDRDGVFALSNTAKGYEVNANNLLSIITVDTTNLDKVLLFTGFAGNLNNGDSTSTIERGALELVDTSFRDEVKLEYQISTLVGSWMSLAELQNYLRGYLTNYTNATSGIIIFNNGSIPGVTIKAKFVPKDDKKFTVVSTPLEEVQLDTKGIKTNVDLKDYVNVLKTQKVIPTGTSPDNLGSLTIPSMSGGNVPFSGKTFNEIEEILKLAIDIQFKAPGSNNDNWVPLTSITKVNVDNDLYIRFIVKDTAKANIELSLVTTNDWESHQNTGFRLKLNLPLEIQTNAADLTNLIKLTGDTKNLGIDDAEVYKKLVETNAEYEGKVDILYTVGKSPMHLDPSSPNKTEFTKTELIALLKLNTIDVTANEKQISARFALANGVSADDFIIKDKTAAILDTASVLLFINKSNYYEIAGKLKVSGTSSNIIWGSDIDTLTSELSKGLVLQYSTNPAATETDSNDDSKWTTQRPTAIDPTAKFLAVRMIVLSGYKFEEEPRLFNVDTTNVLLVITLQSATLDLIKLTGNTRNLEIDLTAFNTAIATVPGRQFIEVQYYFGGTPPTSSNIPAGTDWFSETQIKSILLALRGAKNENELILFRNSLRARYSLNDEGYKNYRMNINGTFIQEQAPEDPSFWRFLVTDTINTGFNGYINLDLINTFVTDSFKVIGSDKRPQLVANDKISQMLDYYKDQATAPFDIYYSKTQGDFSNRAYKLFAANGFINRFDESFTIDLDTNGLPRPIWFKIEARAGYQVYENNALLSGGKEIQITNFEIQPQITNPLSVSPQIRFKSATNQLFYQGEGSLTVYDTTSNQLVDSTFLNREYPDVVPAVLKLQYNVSDKEYTPEELEAVITDASQWKDAVPSTLKVGQYVMVRVALNNDRFTMLGGDAMTPQTRVHGLKVRAENLRLSEDLILTNTEFYGFQALDGQTKIERATILADSLDNYLGADLQMSVNTQFYRNALGKIIVDANNIPIIRRNPNGATASGNYLDAAGQPILDESGRPIPILTIDRNGSKIPAPPLASETWTNPRKMIDSSIIGSFSQEDDGLLDWRLFEGQTVRFSFVARVGQGTTDKPDFVFDETVAPMPEIKLTNIKYIIPTNGVTYRFDTEQLKDITFASDTNEGLAYTGSSHIASQLSAIRVSASLEEKIIVGSDIEKQVLEDFDSRVQVRMKLDKVNGTSNSASGSDIGQFTGLSNGDVITISFESIDENYSLPRPIAPLTIIIKGLFVRPLDTNLFKNLRPNFTGVLNGSGSFSIKVTNPADPSQTNEDILGTDQWYEYQVWSADRQLKTPWTRDETRINNLVNGDKVEWKIVNRDGVFENDYYNTLLANSDTSSEIKFKVVNVVDKIEQTVQEGIGNSNQLNPDINGRPNYPENSGWLVSGLKIEITLDSVQQEKFEQALAQFQPTFSGVDKFGSMNSNIQNDTPISQEVVIVWYAAGPDGVPRKITDFKDARLSNGDKVWATIAPSQYAIDNNLVIDSSISQLQSKVFIVEGLTTIVNSTTQTLIISLISASSVVLVGAIGSVIFVKRRGKITGNKKF